MGRHQPGTPGQLAGRPAGRPTGYVWTNAITIQAPAAQVWPWLVQLGQGRGGLYSYDWLENLIGCDVHSTDQILPQFQQPLQVGDRVIRMTRYAPSAPVALFDPQRALVLGNIKDTDAELTAGHAHSTWAFLLHPVDQHSTRLLVRCRGNSLMARLQGPVQFVMQRKMMLGIKQRAERNPLPRHPTMTLCGWACGTTCCRNGLTDAPTRGRSAGLPGWSGAQAGAGGEDDERTGRLWKQARGHQGHRRSHRRAAPGRRAAGSGAAGGSRRRPGGL